MDALLKRRNVNLVVSIYRYELQVNRLPFKNILKRFKLSEKNYDIRLAQNILKEFSVTKYITYIDLTDRFAAEAEEEDLYLWRDTPLIGIAPAINWRQTFSFATWLIISIMVNFHNNDATWR